MYEAARCLHLLPDTHAAGAENQCRYLLEGLAQAPGLEVELAYFGRGRGHAPFEELGVPLLEVPRRRRFRFDAYGRARRLRRALARRAPDIFHTWLLEGNVIGLLAARAWPGTRVVITQRGSWNEMDHRGLVRLERLLLPRADHAISNSIGGAEMLESIGMARERISIVANGIPPERAATTEDEATVRERLGWSAREVVAWAGRVDNAKTVAQKDLGGLLAAVGALHRRRPSVLLALIGPTTEQIASAGIELPSWAHAIGWSPRPADLLHAADVVAVSSRTEGNSNVAAEALLVGVPVVTTDTGDHCELVRRSGGEVVPAGDPESLARAMEMVLDREPHPEAIRRTAAEALSVARMVERTRAVYDRLIER
jgi:glycosyltransferase involved in cell wall biosynthesis